MKEQISCMDQGIFKDIIVLDFRYNIMQHLNSKTVNSLVPLM